jgi:hypothetical protein
VVRSATALPSLGELVAGTRHGSPRKRAALDLALQLWSAGASTDDLHGAVQRQAAVAYAAPILAELRPAEDWQPVRERTERWISSAHSMLRHLVLPERGDPPRSGPTASRSRGRRNLPRRQGVSYPAGDLGPGGDDTPVRRARPRGQCVGGGRPGARHGVGSGRGAGQAPGGLGRPCPGGRRRDPSHPAGILRDPVGGEG